MRARRLVPSLVLGTVVVLGVASCAMPADDPGYTAPSSAPSSSSPAGAPAASSSAEAPADSHTDGDVHTATPAPPDPGPITIDGVQASIETGREHVTGPVTYDTVPPVGGDHSPVWVTCMGQAYPDPVADEEAVHSLEHGAVWLAYDPALSASETSRVSDLIAGVPYTFASPYPGLPAPVVASAWGLRLQVTDPADPRLAAFVAAYANGPQTPEPGAACTPAPSAMAQPTG